MSADFDLLSPQRPVGTGQENNPDDVEALDDALRAIRAYEPPPEYADGPQRYATEPMIGALERLQEQHGLKIDGVANPGGPTERAINNRLLRKPSGAGLLYDPPAPIGATVGNGFENRPGDVVSLKRKLGALDYIPEDPFDRPSGFIDEAATNAVKAFQRAKGLAVDGWLAPNGETERALDQAVRDLARAEGQDWFQFVERAGRAQEALAPRFVSPPDRITSPDDGDEEEGVVPVRFPPPPRPPQAPPALSPPGSTSLPQIPLNPREIFGVNPDFVPPRRPQLRWSDPLPGGLTITNPGERVRGPQLPLPKMKLPPGIRAPEDEPLSTDDVPRALGRPSAPSVDDEVKRALPIVPRRTEPDVYIPAPGSPLRIPVLDIHHGGIQGDPRTIQTTEDTTTALKEACEKVFPDAVFVREMEKYYRPYGTPPGTRKGSSFADEWMGAFKVAKDLSINFVTDSYTPKADGTPTAAENSRYMKLQYNRQDEEHIVTVRVPKVWTHGQALDKEKLQSAAKEICEQIKKMLDEGEIGPDKRLRIERMLEKLVEPRKKPAPKGEEDPLKTP
jgi:hypothetical protein